MTTITSYELARMIEHVQKLGRDYSYMEAFCLEAKEHHFVAIAAAQAYVSFFREILEGSDVHVSAGFSWESVPALGGHLVMDLLEASTFINFKAGHLYYL